MHPFFLRLLAAEWLKLRRSPALWLTLAGAVIIPFIKIIEAFARREYFTANTKLHTFWTVHYNECWQFMSMFLLPLGIILIVSMLFQTEHSQGGWRQMHWQPVPAVALFIAKLCMVVLLALIFWTVFTAGIWVSAMIPAAVMSDAAMPHGTLFTGRYFVRSASLMLATLPVISLQFVMGMMMRNFLLPAGIGIALFVAALIAIQWKYGAFLPYTWPALEFIQQQVNAAKYYHLHWLPYAFSAVFLIIGYVWYRYRAIKD
jgi:lantibiotic transport system permease protein